ncbi:hypothetical protein KXD40_009226 [Peronospora effusa]|nr:hypothetical protein KXD40_009226 [Peronospora effusa]
MSQFYIYLFRRTSTYKVMSPTNPQDTHDSEPTTTQVSSGSREGVKVRTRSRNDRTNTFTDEGAFNGDIRSAGSVI